MDEGIIPRSKHEDTVQYVKEEILRGAEFITGVSCTSRAEWARSVGHVVQGVISGQVVSNLQKEIEYYIDKGRIEEDFVSSIQGQRCFIELLKFLEQEIPDNDRLELLKRIYVVSATEEIHDRESLLPLQFMQIARNLNHGEIVVLFAAYRDEKYFHSYIRIEDAIKLLVKKTGLEYSELVQLHLESITSKRLMVGRYKDIQITPMGKAFCEFVSYYDEKIAVPPIE